MLASEARLRKSTDISDVLRNGKRYPTRMLIVHLLVKDDVPRRVAFAVGKSVGNSVERHRLTRQLRHIMRAQLNRVPEGSQVVVRALPSAKGATFAQLQESVDFALTKLGDT